MLPYSSYSSRHSRYENFYAFPILANVINVNPAGVIFCTWGHNLNELGSCCIPKINALCLAVALLSFYKPMQNMTPGMGSFWALAV